PLSLHDALPIYAVRLAGHKGAADVADLLALGSHLLAEFNSSFLGCGQLLHLDSRQIAVNHVDRHRYLLTPWGAGSLVPPKRICKIQPRPALTTPAKTPIIKQGWTCTRKSSGCASTLAAAP